MREVPRIANHESRNTWANGTRLAGSDQAKNDVGSMAVIQGGREYDGRPSFGQLSAGKRGYDHVSGFQLVSDSDSPNFRKEAAVASRISSSVQESDHSTGLPAARSASRDAHKIM